MLSEERYRKIMELLKSEGSVKTTQLRDLFGVSMETVRRDLEHLEAEGALKKVFGGAVLDVVDTGEPRFQDRERQHLEGKHQIAQLACRYVHEGQAIAMDVSTTNLEIAKLLRQQLRSLTVLTNSIVIAQELAGAEGFTVILTGGILHSSEMSLTGEMCKSNIRQYNIDLYFISANGISLSSGVTDFGFGEVEAKRAMAEVSKELVLVCNSSRFDVVSLLKVCDLSRVQCIITDSGLDEHVAARYAKEGVRIIRP